MDVDHYIEKALDQKSLEIGDSLDANVMAIIGPILHGAEQKVRTAVDSISPDKKKKRLAIVLETNGGIVEIVERMVTTLRHHFEEMHFIIPDVAMSAGTIFAMSGDTIWMDYFSCLGPIDPQIQKDGKLIPALSYVAQYEALKNKAISGNLTTPELILLQKLDLAELHAYEEAKNLSIALLEDWLTKYKFKDWSLTESQKKPVTEEMKRSRAKEIAEALSDPSSWHSHGRPISMKVLQEKLNLKIDNLATNIKLNESVQLYSRLLTDYMARMGIEHFVHTLGICL